MRESFIEKKVTNFAIACDWISYKLQGQHNRGLPDRMYLKQGKVLFVEFKAPGRRPSKLQQHLHQTFKQQGFTVHVIDSIETGKQLFKPFSVEPQSQNA